MSISGSLEDVSVADVMQFIHLGRRTGTLMLQREREKALIGFHDGRLISAQGPHTPNIGDLLVNGGLITRDALRRAVEIQRGSVERRALGQILISEGTLEAEALRDAVSRQIEATIGELVAWEAGTFEFAVDDLTPIDEIAFLPGEIMPAADINTQMVLLEAARIFDERSRDESQERAESGEPRAAKTNLEDTHPMVDPPGLSAAQAAEQFDDAELRLERLETTSGAAGPVLHLVSQDENLAATFAAELSAFTRGIEVRSLADAGETELGAGGAGTIVLVDLREGSATLEDVEQLHRRHPAVSLVALVDRVMPTSQVYGAGALAALPAEPEAVAACIQNIIQSQRRLAYIGSPRSDLRAGGGAGVARLRRVFGDLRSGLLSATVALNLMHIISESVERAVLFLVRHDCLQALGAFGIGANGRPLAELTRGMRLALDEPSVLADSLESGETLTVRYNDAVLPQRLKDVVGRPLTGQVVIFPVLGARRVISVIYTDNGEVDRAIEDIEILELATAQVGMAFENELLRRQISRQDL